MYTYMFQYNIPQDNNYADRTDGYINVIAEWDGKTFYASNKPLVCVQPVNMTFYECILIKDWIIARHQIEKIAENHFANLARQIKIDKAKAELIEAGELVENPVLSRYEPDVQNLNPFMADIIKNHFTAAI